jgi:hypothetical protein
MNSRFVIWAAVAAAVAVMVFALAPRSNVGTQNKTPTPSATPSALSQGLLRGPLSPGAYRIDDVFPIRATFDLPADWLVGEEFAQGKVELYKALRGRGSGEGALGEVRSNIDAAAISFYVVSNAYVDPCHTLDGPMSPPLGPRVDELVNVLTSPSGFKPARSAMSRSAASAESRSISPTRSTPSCARPTLMDGSISGQTRAPIARARCAPRYPDPLSDVSISVRRVK